MDERQLREQMCEVGLNLWRQQMVAANDGNISARLPSGEILCTPASVSKAALTPDKIVKVTGDGEVVHATEPFRPSSELPMHLHVYATDPSVGSVLHAHPVFGTVFAVKGQSLTRKMLPESVIHMPEIPLAPYATPSTRAVGESVAPFVRDYEACLLEQHGGLSWGPDLTAASLAMERLEYTAKITYLLDLIGVDRELPQHEIDTLIGMRSQYGR